MIRAGKVERPSPEGLMRWLLAALTVSSMAMTGCPSEFGKEGRVNQAVHKDAQDLAIRRCSDELIAEVCAPGKENSDECRKCRQGGMP